MKHIFFIAMLFLPLLAVGQEKCLTKKQCKETIEALAQLKKQYARISYVYGSDLVIVTDSNNRDGIVNLHGKTILPCKYGIYCQSESPMLLIENDSLMGFIDRKGNWIHPLQYKKIRTSLCDKNHLFGDDEYLTVKKHGFYGAIDKNGKTIVPFQYDKSFSYDFKNNLLFFINYKRDGNSVYTTDLKGNIINGPYNFLTCFHDGLAKFERDGLYGYVDTKGNEVIPNQYEQAKFFTNGQALVKQNEYYGIIDKKGNYLFRFSGDSLEIYNKLSNVDMLLCSKKGIKHSLGAINLQGETLIPFQYDYVLDDNNPNFICMLDDSYNYDIYDSKGNFMDRYDEINSHGVDDSYISPTYFSVRKDSLWGFVDSNFNRMVPCRYKEAAPTDFNYGIVILDNGNMAIIDMTGKTIAQGPFDVIYPEGKDFFGFGTWSPDGTKNISGYIDAYGNCTASPEEMALMTSWVKQSYKRNRINKEESHRCIDKKNRYVEKKEERDEIGDGIYTFVEETPKFPGGDSALYMFICMNLSYPDEAREQKIEGNVLLSFVIEKDGSVSNIKKITDIGGGCGDAAVEMLSKMPKWKPARYHGKPVRFEFQLPLLFQLDDDDSHEFETVEEKCHYEYNLSVWK